MALATLLGLFLILQLPVNAGAQGRAVHAAPAYPVPLPTDSGAVAVRTDAPPIIDGRDDDAVWRDTPPITEFREWNPTQGKAPRFRTEAKVAYDAANLYVFVRAYDPHPDSIIRILERR
ncbi:MAG: sugar-binding protein, partial [Gemmatimonadaceae bacterium]